MNKLQFNVLKKRVKHFLVEGNLLFCQVSKNVPLYWVIDDVEMKQAIIQNLYDETGYKGQDRITNCITTQY